MWPAEISERFEARTKDIVVNSSRKGDTKIISFTHNRGRYKESYTVLVFTSHVLLQSKNSEYSLMCQAPRTAQFSQCILDGQVNAA